MGKIHVLSRGWTYYSIDECPEICTQFIKSYVEAGDRDRERVRAGFTEGVQPVVDREAVEEMAKRVDEVVDSMVRRIFGLG